MSTMARTRTTCSPRCLTCWFPALSCSMTLLLRCLFCPGEQF
ncbi:hypothetical protein P4133_32540 [Pseudomonas aeruginosa]|nr:hypothetical protein [Pseudomonas aeruginosa]